MRLSKQQFLQAKTALLDGYDRAGLRRMVRLGLDISLDEITSGTTDSDVVFDLIEWAERSDKVPDLIQAAVESNDHNEALKQLKQDSSTWFAPGASTKAAEAHPTAETSHAPAPNVPQYSAGGDVIVANIGGGAENVAVGKNIRQVTDEPEPRKKK
ncbi:MAG: effector-associated domain EAD1-containing protein [Caldilineaceae bacterium]